MTHRIAPSDRRPAIATATLSRLCPLVALCTLGCPPPAEPADPATATDSATTVESPDSNLTSTEVTTSDPFASSSTTTTTGTGNGDGGSDGSSGSGGSTGPEGLPDTPTLSLGYSPIKQFDFTWAPVAGSEYYQVLERPDPDTPAWTQLGEDLIDSSLSWLMPIHLRANASYSLRACNINGCSESAPVPFADLDSSAVGYFKASNAKSHESFGIYLGISADGNTLVVGAPDEDSCAHGVNGNPYLDDCIRSGAAYVFVRNGAAWSQEAYLKSLAPDILDFFGTVTISGDGNTIAVGVPFEDGSTFGVGGDPTDNGRVDSGAVYVFVRKAGTWSQQAYIKASNPGSGDDFGKSLALSADGNTLAVGAPEEGSDATGIDGFPFGGVAKSSGAAYVYRRSGDTWSHSAYIKASNTDSNDYFGTDVALSGDGATLAVGAPYESSASAGVDGDQSNNSKSAAGAVYVFSLTSGAWKQQAYVKASLPDAWDRFGHSVALSFDGKTLAVGAYGEASAATEIDGDQANNDAQDAGAVYIFSRFALTWTQQAYIKAPNADEGDLFGESVTLSATGDMLVVGAPLEDGGGTGVQGDLFNKRPESGAAYVFTRSDDQWAYKSYVKASIPDTGDWFAGETALAADGSTLAIGSPAEQSLATGIGGFQADNSGKFVGAVYMY